MEGYVRPCTETRSGNSKTSQNTSGNPFVSLLQFRMSCIALFFSSCVQNQSPKLSYHVLCWLTLLKLVYFRSAVAAKYRYLQHK